MQMIMRYLNVIWVNKFEYEWIWSSENYGMWGKFEYEWGNFNMNADQIKCMAWNALYLT